MRRQTKPQLTSSRMPNHHHPPGVELILPRTLHQKLIPSPHIRKRPRPSTPRISHPPVLQIRGSNPLRRQRRAQMPHIPQVVLRPPISAMNRDRQPMRPLALRHPQIHKLIRIAAISHTSIRRRRSQTQNVIGRCRHGRFTLWTSVSPVVEGFAC
jgi:hypothetical protein